MRRNASLETLPVAGDSASIRVYFGSWSEICDHILPKIMRVEEEWRPLGARFDYYGLPQPLTEDPIALREGIVGVPTAVHYVGGAEIGRRSGRPLDNPKETFYEILAGGEEPE